MLGRLARARGPRRLRRWVIRTFMARYRVDLAESEPSCPEAYGGGHRNRVGGPGRASARGGDSGAGAARARRGAEMERFFLGSTVIVLLPRGAAVWNEHCIAGAPVRMGQQPLALPHDSVCGPLIANSCGQRLDFYRIGGANKRLVLCRQRNPSPYGEFQVGRVIGRQPLRSGKRQNFLKGAGRCFGVGRDR